MRAPILIAALALGFAAQAMPTARYVASQTAVGQGSFAPAASLGPSLKGWLNADDHGTANMADDGAGLISSWTDRTGAVAFTAATTARPTWTPTVVLGKAGVVFDGAANCMTSTSFTAWPTGSAAGEIWVSGIQDAPGASVTNGYFLRYGGTGASSARFVAQNTAGGGSRARAGDGTAILADTKAEFTGFQTVAGAWIGTTMTGRITGRSMDPSSATIVTLATGTTRARIGSSNGTSCSNFLQGPVRHILVTLTLSGAQQQQLGGWLVWDVAAPWRLPAGHPYKRRRP